MVTRCSECMAAVDRIRGPDWLPAELFRYRPFQLYPSIATCRSSAVYGLQFGRDGFVAKLPDTGCSVKVPRYLLCAT
jgi:hypothetical protein